MKPICAMVEYANMRFKLVCAIAVRLPMASEAIAKTINMFCQSNAITKRPSTSRRINMANAASLGAPLISKVEMEGEP